MSEEIRKLQDDVDSADQKKDRKVSIEGMEKELTETYIKKLDTLLERMDKVDPAETELARSSIIEELQATDAQNITDRWARFDTSLETDLAILEDQIQIRGKIEGLGTAEWDKTGGFPLNYENLRVKNYIENMSAGNVDNLANYISKAPEIAERFTENTSFFTEGIAQTPETNPTLRIFLGENVVKNILSGKISNPDELLQSFKKAAKEAEEKRESCEQFMKALQKAGEYATMAEPILSKDPETGLTEEIENPEQYMTEDQLREYQAGVPYQKILSRPRPVTKNIFASMGKEQMIDLFIVLVERKKINPKDTAQTVSELVKHDEIRAFFEETKQNPEKGKDFLMAEIPKLQDLSGKDKQKEMCKTRARLLAESILSKQKAEIQKQLDERNEQLQETQKELEQYKEKFLRNSVLYANMEVMESPDTVEHTVSMPQTGEEISMGNFRRLVKMEEDIKTQEVNLLASQLALVRNEAATAMISLYIDQTYDQIFAQENSNPEQSLKTTESLITNSLSEIEDENNREKFTRLQEMFDADNTAGTKSASFAEIERLRALYFVKREEAGKISNDDGTLQKELTYRKFLEGSTSQSYIEEDQKAYIIDKRESRTRELHKESLKLEKLIAENYAEIETSIDRYGSVYLMPENERELVLQKATTLVAVIGTSIEFAGRLRSSDMELRVIDPEHGLKDDVLAKLKDSETKNKELLKKVTKFLGNEIDLTQAETQILTPETAGLVLNSLNEKAGPLVDKAMDNYAEKAEQVGTYFKGVEQRAKEAQMVEKDLLSESSTREHKERRMGISRWDVADEGITKLSEMASAFNSGKDGLLQARGVLQNKLANEEDVFKENPKLLETRREMIKNIIENIDKMLATVFSDKNKQQINEQIQAIKTHKREMFLSLVKTAIILAATVALAMASGGIAAVGVGRLCTFLGGRALQYVGAAKFVAGNVAVAAGSTLGQRGVQEGMNAAVRGFGEAGVNLGEEYQVDWNLGSMATDFGKSLAMAVMFTGAGRLAGSKIAKIKTSSGLTYGELSEMGLTRMGFLENMANPFKIFGKGSTTGLKGIGREFMEEVSEEAIQEGAEAINPVLGGLFALAASTSGGNIEVNTNTQAKANVASVLADIGVGFNKESGRYEFGQPNAREFGTELLQKLEESHNALDMTINPDGSITVKQKGTDNTVTLHPKNGVQANIETVTGNPVTDENFAMLDITPETRQSTRELLTGTDPKLKTLTETLVNTGDAKSLQILGKAHRKGDTETLGHVAKILGYEADMGNYEKYGAKGLIGLAQKLNAGNPEAAMEDATHLAKRLVDGSGLTIEAILAVNEELNTLEEAYTGTAELTPEMLRARMAKKDVETLRAGISQAQSIQDIETLIGRIESPAEQQILRQAWDSLHALDVEEDALSLEHSKAIFRESAGYLSDHLSAMEAGGFEGAQEMTAQRLFSIIESNQRKLAYQTIVDERHLTGSDHGTMHVLNGDMENALRVAEKLGLTPQQRILMRQAIIDHDMGYAQQTLRGKSGDEFFGMTKDHPLYSTLMLEANREAYVQAFGEEGYQAIRSTVLHHSNPRGIDVQNRPGLETVRDILSAADALQVTSDLKMMGLFRHPQFIAEMKKIGHVWNRVGRGEITREAGITQIQGIKDKMLRMVDQGPFSPKLKQAYKEAISNNFDPASTQFMVNRDFGAYVGGFEGMDIDPAGRLIAKFNIYGSQELISGIFGDKTATASFTKAMEDYGLKEGDSVVINGQEVTFSGKDFSARIKGLKVGETITVETPKGRFEFTKKAENPESIKEFNSAIRQTHELGEFVENLGRVKNMPQAEISAKLEQTREHLSRYTVEGKSTSELLAPFYAAHRRGLEIDQEALRTTLENIYYNGNIALT